MLLLMLFALVAGAATAVTPCVLPVLPVVLSAGATGGRRRPLGIVAGLTASFTFATVALVYVIAALGLPDDLLRTLAIAVLIGFGVALLVPPLAARVEGRLSRLAGRVSRPAAGDRRGAQGDGFWSGTIVGASLGLVYAPCAGPILAGVITVSAAQSFTVARLAVALCYGIGSAIVLYLLMLGGRRITAPLARRSGRLQIAMGAVMVLVAVAMLGDYDLRFETAVARDLPGFLVNPSQKLEASNATRDALASVRRPGGGGGLGAAAAQAKEPTDAPARGHGRGADRLRLPVIGRAPDFTGTQRWFNTPHDRPLTMRSLRGHVVLVDFWTYSCVNCLRTLPYLKAWYKRYHRDGFEIVGVHTPEFPFEKEASNVAAAIDRNGLRYPVVQDNESATWNAYGNQYWPAEYFIDARGRVRYAHFGEGSYRLKERVIRTLLADAGKRKLGRDSGAHGIEASAGVTTPESYLGALRAQRFANGTIRMGPQVFDDPGRPRRDGLAYVGHWRIGPESATAEGGSLRLAFGARRVYLVLGSPGRARRVRVLLDGRPLPDALAGSDVHDGAVTVRSQRLYELVDLPRVERHQLTLEPEPGVTGYAFTFG